MKMKSTVTNLLVAMLSATSLLSCSYDEMDADLTTNTIDDESSVWSEFDPENKDTELINSVKIKFTDNFNLSDIFIDSRATNKKYTVPLNYNKNGEIYQVEFKPRGLEVRYKTENLAWLPNIRSSYDITILANHDAEVSFKILSIDITGIAPRQTLSIGVQVTSTEDGITTKYILGFSARLHGLSMVIEDKNHIEP